MKALFIGLGSVGQRHLQNFIALRPHYTPIIAYRTSKSNRVIKNGDIVPNKHLSDYYNLIEFTEIDQALNENPDVSFICNPSSLHLETALKIAENKIHFFIEKPLAVVATGINDLENIMRGPRSKFFSGFSSLNRLTSATTSVVEAVIPEFAIAINIFLGVCRRSIVFFPVPKFLTNQIKPP